MDILIVKTFGVIAIMLLLTTLAARRNNAFETKLEFWGIFLGTLALAFTIPFVGMPYKVILAGGFALMMGALIGPGIKGMMISYVLRKHTPQIPLSGDTYQNMSWSEKEKVLTSVSENLDLSKPEYAPLIKDWNNILTLALVGTGAMTCITALTVYVSGIDFSFLGTGLFVALIGLIVMGLMNYFIFKSPLIRLIGSYVGALIFSLFLLYDFNQLEKVVALGDTSWTTAINIGTSIYIDIVNLFMDLLDILSSR
jgi:hypothetical protein